MTIRVILNSDGMRYWADDRDAMSCRALIYLGLLGRNGGG